MNLMHRFSVIICFVVFYSQICSAETLRYSCLFRSDSAEPQILDQQVHGKLTLKSCGLTPQGLKVLIPNGQGCVANNPLELGSPLVLWERGTPSSSDYYRLATGFWITNTRQYRLCGMFSDLQKFSPWGALANAGHLSRPELGCNSNYVTLAPNSEFTFYGSGDTAYVQCTISILQ